MPELTPRMYALLDALKANKIGAQADRRYGTIMVARGRDMIWPHPRPAEGEAPAEDHGFTWGHDFRFTAASISGVLLALERGEYGGRERPSEPEPEAEAEAEEEVDDPAPTLAERAQAAQDKIGWARMPASDQGGLAEDFGCGTLDLARVVVELARRVERLEAQLAEARNTRT